MTRRKRPYATTAFVLWTISALLIVPSIVQLFAGVPVSEGLAPAGFSVGPLLAIGGTVLFFSERPRRGERWVDDGVAIDQMNNTLNAADPHD